MARQEGTRDTLVRQSRKWKGFRGLWKDRDFRLDLRFGVARQPLTAHLTLALEEAPVSTSVGCGVDRPLMAVLSSRRSQRVALAERILQGTSPCDPRLSTARRHRGTSPRTRRTSSKVSGALPWSLHGRPEPAISWSELAGCAGVA